MKYLISVFNWRSQLMNSENFRLNSLWFSQGRRILRKGSLGGNHWAWFPLLSVVLYNNYISAICWFLYAYISWMIHSKKRRHFLWITRKVPHNDLEIQFQSWLVKYFVPVKLQSITFNNKYRNILYKTWSVDIVTYLLNI